MKTINKAISQNEIAFIFINIIFDSNGCFVKN